MKANLDRTTKIIVLQLGQEYEPAVLPSDIPRGQVGNCFDWCALQTAKLHPKYGYVEGIVSNPENPKEWVLYGWMTDGVHAFDPTWNAIKDVTGKEVPMPSVYIGIGFDIRAVRDFIKLTGYQGILANRKRAPELWKVIKKGIKKERKHEQTAKS